MDGILHKPVCVKPSLQCLLKKKVLVLIVKAILICFFGKFGNIIIRQKSARASEFDKPAKCAGTQRQCTMWCGQNEPGTNGVFTHTYRGRNYFILPELIRKFLSVSSASPSPLVDATDKLFITLIRALFLSDNSKRFGSGGGGGEARHPHAIPLHQKQKCECTSCAVCQWRVWAGHTEQKETICGKS